MSAPAPPAPLPFSPHSCPTDASFWPPNQELWPTQQYLEPFSRFTTDFPQFPQLEINPNEPPFKKSRSSEEPAPSNSNLRTVSSNPPQRFHNHFQGDYGPEKNRGISRMFFKTKLCCKFQLGICPYSTNCNFAHGNQEIRKPPPNWQEIVAAHEDDRQLRSERREDIHTPFLPPAEYQRISKLRICKKFYSGEGCPYGDRCTFLHEDPDRARESIAITTNSSRCGPDSIESTNGLVNSNNGDGPNGLNQKPVYWKTRFCNKWETTGHCPFGDKCHFAHGLADLQNYGGPTEVGNGNSGITPLKPLSNSADDISPNQRSSKQEQRQSHGSFPKLKGSTKINRIYADWIDDNDLDLSMHSPFGEQS